MTSAQLQILKALESAANKINLAAAIATEATGGCSRLSLRIRFAGSKVDDALVELRAEVAPK